MPSEAEPKMVEMLLSRIVMREDSAQQFIFLNERGGGRGFPIVIGAAEAAEIHRVVTSAESPRPLTHQLAHSILQSLDADIVRCDIVDLRQNTFFAQLILRRRNSNEVAIVDARPSDAIALALRAKATIRVAESVLDQVRTDTSSDPLPPTPEPPA
ncbi:MAG TPA: bifunctional nuclease family protein [Planctomycetota bacterium]|nr:bifunctional nuclease family protein [Planctomycetota bacterium]